MLTCKDCNGDKNGKCPNGRFAFGDMEICPLFQSHELTRPRFCRYAESPSAMAELLVYESNLHTWVFMIEEQHFSTKEKAVKYAVKWLLEGDKMEDEDDE